MSRFSYHAVAGNLAHIPLHGGVYIWHPTKREQGTLGCMVTRAGKTYALSNQHVFGVDTVGKDVYDYYHENKLARVAFTTSLSGDNDYVDAALATPIVPVSFEIPGIGAPRGHVDPQVGMKVKMYGARSGFQRGTITRVNSRMANGKTGVFLIDIKAIPGDSGALVVNESNMAVGLFFGEAGVGGSCCKASAIIKAYPGLSFVGTGKTLPSIQPIPPATANEPKVIQAGFNIGDLKQEQIILGVGALLGLFLLSRG